MLNRIANYQTAFSLHRKENPKLTKKNCLSILRNCFLQKAQVWDIKITDGSFPVMNFESEVTVLKLILSLCTS